MLNALKKAARWLALMAAAAIPALSHAHADWPERPIKLIVPFAPGGATDQVARLMAAKISQTLKTPVIVDNKPGANGNIGADFVAKSAPDGYTFLHTTSALAFTAAFKQKVPYVLDKDIVPVSLVVNQPLLIMSSLQSGVIDLQTLRDYVKRNGGQISYASSGNGNLTHLAMYVILHSLGIEATHVPYKGGAAAFPDFIAGRIELFSDPINSAYPYVRDKRVKALAVTGERRSALDPSIPTVNESLLPGFTMGAWQGLLAPAGTPQDIVDKVRSAYVKALQEKDVQATLAAQGAEAVGSSGEQFRAFIGSEISRWTKVVESSGIKLN